MDTLGPVVLDLIGTTLSVEEAEILNHPLVGGVILFTRNYESRSQLNELCRSIRAARKTPLLITVDQEGGRVQRFREGFTTLPSMGEIGKCYEKETAKALLWAELTGWIMATECLSVGIDLSFAPVLDLNKNNNKVVGDRAFHHHPGIVIALAKAYIRGMRTAGMRSTGKHFPGHGSVKEDSHIAMPVDDRSFDDVLADDMKPFLALIPEDLDGIMPAHITFSKVDSQAVGFSSYWLQTILRQHYQFSGWIWSDDLNMQGASTLGDTDL